MILTSNYKAAMKFTLQHQYNGTGTASSWRNAREIIKQQNLQPIQSIDTIMRGIQPKTQHGITVSKHAAGHLEFKSNKGHNSAPKILREYKDGEVRMYECEGDRHFIADTYDKMYMPAKTKMRPKGYKGVIGYKTLN